MTKVMLILDNLFLAVSFSLLMESQSMMSVDWDDGNHPGCKKESKLDVNHWSVFDRSLDAMNHSIKEIAEISSVVKNYSEYKDIVKCNKSFKKVYHYLWQGENHRWKLSNIC